MAEDKAAKTTEPEIPSDASATGAAIAGSVARFNKPNVNARTMLLMPEFWTGIVEQMFGLAPPPEPPAEPETPEVPAGPTLMSLAPNTAVVGGDDFVMTLTGTGFTADSVIVFNGGDEPTTMNSDTELTTIVDPATASGPITVPVLVRTGGVETAPLDFTFTA